MKKKKNYIEPEDFFEETLKCIIAGEISDGLGKMFMKISEKFVNHPNFVRYTHIREDFISTGCVACCRAYSQFRPDRNILTRDEDGVITSSTAVAWDGKIVPYDHNKHYNPHAFFSTVINNAILQFLKREYGYKNTINAIKLSHGLDADYGYVDMIKEQENEDRDSFDEPLNENLFVGSSLFNDDDDEDVVVKADRIEAAEKEEEEKSKTDHVGIIW